ncbi:phage baseplate assembly protein V [Dryocola clanedunensis]
MDDLLGDLQRRVANMVRRGVISDVNLAGPRPTCRVRLGNNVTDWLPLCQWGASQYQQDFHPAAAGDAVTVISEAGDLNNGRVFPGWNTDAVAIPSGDKNTHITRYEDGTEIRYDRKVHALTIALAQGGTYKIVGEGTLDGPVLITKNLTVAGNTMLQASLDVASNVTAKGEVLDAKGTMNQIRTTYNGHNHKGDSGGTTGTPNQSM